MTSQIRNSVAVFVSLPLRTWICPLSPQPFLPRDTITQHNFHPSRSEQRGGLAGWRLVSYSIDQRPWKCPIIKYKVSPTPRKKDLSFVQRSRPGHEDARCVCDVITRGFSLSKQHGDSWDISEVTEIFAYFSVFPPFSSIRRIWKSASWHLRALAKGVYLGLSVWKALELV